MILRSRKWRLVIRVIALGLTSILMLAFAGPVSYALQDDTPKPIASISQLYNKHNAVANTYVNITAVPDLTRALAVREGDTTYYWIPLTGYDNELFVRTKELKYLLPPNLFPGLNFSSHVHYTGKITTFTSQSGSDKAIKELEVERIYIDKNKAMVLSQGETPSAYRPIVPVMPVLAWMWGVALIGLFQIWRGRQPHKKL
jgi:hypothetical protein